MVLGSVWRTLGFAVDRAGSRSAALGTVDDLNPALPHKEEYIP